MRLTRSTVIVIFFPLLLLSMMGAAQDSISSTTSMINYLFKKTDPPGFSFPEENILSFSPDSLTRKKLEETLSLPDTGFLSGYFPGYQLPAASLSSKSFIKMGSGYVSYNWSYRSGNDSSVFDNNVSQHMITGSFSATIAETIPVRVTYFERRSNSAFFKDFKDISIDIDVQRYRQLRAQKALRNLKRPTRLLQDPRLPGLMQAVNSKLDQYRSILDDPRVIKELIRAKETLIRKDFADTSARYLDSVRSRAKQFMEVYDTLRSKKARYLQFRDSLARIYETVQEKIKKAERLFSGKTLSAAEIEQLAAMHGKNDPAIQRLRGAYSGLRRLTVGRTLPDFTNLTLQNVNVNGINAEYSKRNYYFAVSAGFVDFRIRDFLYSQQKLPRQYVYAARAGYGSKESDHLILTYFRGRKQLFGGNLQKPSADIQGISLAGQIFIDKQIRLYGEIAQSGVPYALGGNNSAKPAIAVNDNSQRAYGLGFAANFRRTQTSAEGYYQHTGLNYQSFNSFQYNATANSWSLKVEQLLWKQQLALQASFRKNDFVNPLVLQRYNANTIFKSFTMTFRRPKWPMLSVGYLPASQYTAVGNMVYENHYQAFTGNISHQYPLGIARAATLVSFSRFFNDSRDSGFVYYNARNFFVSQSFHFTRFTATLNISGMNNGQHQLIVMEEGLSANLFKKVNAGFAIKINNLNRATTKIGFNARTRATIKKVGELNLWMEQNYLPAMHQDLYKYEVYNIGLVRYFNQR